MFSNFVRIFFFSRKIHFQLKLIIFFLWNKKYHSIFRTKFFLHKIRKEIFLHNLKRNLSSHFSKRIFSSHFREKNFLPQFRNLFFFHEKKFVENNFCFEKFFSKQKLFSQWEKKISFEFLETKKSLTCPVGGVPQNQVMNKVFKKTLILFKIWQKTIKFYLIFLCNFRNVKYPRKAHFVGAKKWAFFDFT